MSDSTQSRSIFSVGIDSLYAILLALCFIVGTATIFKDASTKQLFAYTDNKGEVIIRSYVQGYICGAIAASPDCHKIFDPKIQLEYTNRAISPLKTDKYIFSQYMPYLFTLMIPFALLEIRTAFFVWTIFAAISCGIGLWLLMTDSRRLSKLARACFLIGFAASLPNMINIYFGGLSPFIVGLLCVYFWGFNKRHDLLAGFALALSTLKPQYTVFAAIPCLAHKRFKLIAAAAIGEMLLLILAGLNVGWENVINYPQILLNADTSSEFLGVFPEKMVSLRGPLSSLLPPHLSMQICLAAMAVAFAGLFWLWTKTADDKSDQVAWAMSATMLAVMIVSPHTHIYDCIYLVLPAVLTLKTPSLTRNFFSQPAEFSLWSYLLLLYPLMSWGLYLGLVNFGNWSSYWALIYNSIMLLIAVRQWRRAGNNSSCE